MKATGVEQKERDREGERKKEGGGKKKKKEKKERHRIFTPKVNGTYYK